MATKLHVVCLDAPSPPNYGGAIDMFYKIKALAKSGIEITLHYFSYKNQRNTKGLQEYCTGVFAYKRSSFLAAPTFSKPHIVASRSNVELAARLNSDDAPILLEGIHCTGIIPLLKNQNRSIFVRLHNNEAHYYKQLAKWERNFFKSAYFALESFLLHRYQQQLAPQVTYLAITSADAQVFAETYKKQYVSVLPPFLPWQHVSSRPGAGTYCLYHGNLAVAENNAAARWLVQHVFAKLHVPFIIAGRKASAGLKREAANYPHIQLINNPTDAQLETLIADAHINVLPDFNGTGIKLKLLHALFCGRFCITNSTEIAAPSTIAIADSAATYMGFLKSYMLRPFTEADIKAREAALAAFNNTENARTFNAFL